MERAGSAERSLRIGLPAAITADKGRIVLQGCDLLVLAGLGQFTYMQGMIVRVGTQIIDVNQSVAHDPSPLGLSAKENIGQIGDNLRKGDQQSQANYLDGDEGENPLIDITHGILRWRHPFEVEQGIAKGWS